MNIIFSTRWSLQEKNSWPKSESRNIFTTSKAPSVVGPYSKSYFAWDLLFISGQIWINPETSELISRSIDEQTKQACRNISNILIENSLSLKDVVKTTIYLKRISDYEKVNDLYKNYFVMKPARTVVEVSNLPKWALIEIEAIAQKPKKENELTSKNNKTKK